MNEAANKATSKAMLLSKSRVAYVRWWTEEGVSLDEEMTDLDDSGVPPDSLFGPVGVRWSDWHVLLPGRPGRGPAVTACGLMVGLGPHTVTSPTPLDDDPAVGTLQGPPGRCAGRV